LAEIGTAEEAAEKAVFQALLSSPQDLKGVALISWLLRKGHGR
jgi:hypothetical protein